MKQRDSLTSSAIRVAGFDIGVSFLAGLMIVPAAFVALGSPEAVTENSGPGPHVHRVAADVRIVR